MAAVRSFCGAAALRPPPSKAAALNSKRSAGSSTADAPSSDEICNSKHRGAVWWWPPLSSSLFGDLLRWQAAPTLPMFQLLLQAHLDIVASSHHPPSSSRRSTPSASSSSYPSVQQVVRQLLEFSPPQLVQNVFALSCYYNLPQVAKLCIERGADPTAPLPLPAAAVDSGIPPVPKVWQHCGHATPILYAASLGYADLVKTLESHACPADAGADPFASYDGVTDDEDIGCLLLAAFGGHATLVDYIIGRTPSLTADERARAYEVLGAVCVIANSSAVGKIAWKKAIAQLEQGGGHKSRHATTMGNLEETIEFRTVDEVVAMRAKELRIQALIILERHLGLTRLFPVALLARAYTVRISIYTLDVLLQSDRLTVDNMVRVRTHLAELGFFKVADLSLTLDCLEWCVSAVGHIRQLLQVYPINRADWVRYAVMVEFSGRVMLCLEQRVAGVANGDRCSSLGVYAVDDDVDDRLSHLLRRIVGVCHPLACVHSLLHRVAQLHMLRHDQTTHWGDERLDHQFDPVNQAAKHQNDHHPLETDELPSTQSSQDNQSVVRRDDSSVEKRSAQKSRVDSDESESTTKVRRRANIFDLLVTAGADLSALDSAGNSVLHQVAAIMRHWRSTTEGLNPAAAESGFDIIECLLRAGADVDATNNNGESARIMLTSPPADMPARLKALLEYAADSTTRHKQETHKARASLTCEY